MRLSANGFTGPAHAPDDGLRHTTDPATLRPMIKANLETLGVDASARDGTAPRGESVAEHFATLAGMREEGLIRHLPEARAIAPVAAVRNRFHAGKCDDTELLTVCEEAGIAFARSYPLGGGNSDLAGGRMAKVAERHGATVPQIALAWLLASSPVTPAIPGTGSGPRRPPAATRYRSPA